MASETGKRDLSALTPKCKEDKFMCAQRMFYTEDYVKDKTQFIECTDQPDETKCYTPDSSAEKFFNIIDPEKLYNSFNFNKGTESIMKDFITELNEKLNQNKNVKKKLISAYEKLISASKSPGIDIKSLDHNNILSEYIPKQKENGDQESCHDIIGNVCLTTSPTSNSIFHISIHPKTSKNEFERNKGTKIGSCGYYKKRDKKLDKKLDKKPDTEGSVHDTEGSVHDTEGSVPDTEGSGSFHYKIDNILKQVDTDKNKPFKKFINADNGTFTENSDDFKRKKNIETDTTNTTSYDDTFYEVHNFFYEEFRKFWNSKIVTNPKFRMTTSEVPEQHVDHKRASEDQSSTGQSEATEAPKPQPPEILGGDKRIRRKTNKKRKTIKKRKINKKRKTKKRKTKKRIPIKKRKTSKR